MESCIKEAKDLLSKISKALYAIKFKKEDYKESEVLFRLTSIEGILIIAQNDAIDLVKYWKKHET